MNGSGVYDSPIGKIFLTANETGLTGLKFDGNFIEKTSPVIERSKEWLDIYFSGREPNFTPPLNITGTPFQISVWNALKKIPYGATKTYGEIASELRTSARAVGNAVGSNPFSIIIPCHRVVGRGGYLTGYSCGIDKKIKLLELEKIIFDEKGRVAHGE